MWATRVWWQLRAFGFERCSVLDGGMEKWRAEGRRVTTEACAYRPNPAFAFDVDRRSDGLILDTEGVKACLAAGVRGGAVVVDALQEHASPTGMLDGAVRLPWPLLFDRDAHTFRPAEAVREELRRRGIRAAGDAQRCVAY